MGGDTHFKELMHTEATDIDNAGINLASWPIEDLLQDVIVSTLHAQGPVEQLCCKTLISRLKIRGCQSLRKQEIGVTASPIYFTENVINQNSHSIWFWRFE
jgi:hypothetical protein